MHGNARELLLAKPEVLYHVLDHLSDVDCLAACRLVCLEWSRQVTGRLPHAAPTTGVASLRRLAASRSSVRRLSLKWLQLQGHGREVGELLAALPALTHLDLGSGAAPSDTDACLAALAAARQHSNHKHPYVLTALVTPCPSSDAGAAALASLRCLSSVTLTSWGSASAASSCAAATSAAAAALSSLPHLQEVTLVCGGPHCKRTTALTADAAAHLASLPALVLRGNAHVPGRALRALAAAAAGQGRLRRLALTGDVLTTADGVAALAALTGLKDLVGAQMTVSLPD